MWSFLGFKDGARTSNIRLNELGSDGLNILGLMGSPVGKKEKRGRYNSQTPNAILRSSSPFKLGGGGFKPPVWDFRPLEIV